MRFIDITDSKKNRYALGENEKAVFFMKNRSGTVEFILGGRGAEAHIFAIFEGNANEEFSLDILQHHKAPGTASSALVKSLLSDTSSLSYGGLIRIDKGADGSDAKQENRNLLLSESASAISIPSLEILTNDVVCEHASTTGTLSEEAVLYMKTRGLSQEQAERLLAYGFRKSLFEEIGRYGTFPELAEYERDFLIAI